MTPPDKVSAVLQDLGVFGAQLRWQISPRGKPHSFRVTLRDITLNGSTARATIRAIKRRFGGRVAA